MLSIAVSIRNTSFCSAEWSFTWDPTMYRTELKFSSNSSADILLNAITIFQDF